MHISECGLSKIGILVPREKPRVFSDDAMNARENNEFMYLEKFKQVVSKTVREAGCEVLEVPFNSLMETFRKDYNNDYHAIQKLHQEARSGERQEVFNLNRYKVQFLEEQIRLLKMKKPNISEKEARVTANYYWEMYLRGPEGLNVKERELYKERFQSTPNFRYYDAKDVRAYQAAKDRLVGTLRNHPTIGRIIGIAGPGNYYNTIANQDIGYCINENFHRAAIAEALEAMNLAAEGVCGSEQAFMFHRGADMVGGLQQHNFEEADRKTAVSLLVPGSMLHEACRRSPDLSKDAVTEIVTQALAKRAIENTSAEDRIEIVNRVMPEIEEIYRDCTRRCDSVDDSTLSKLVNDADEKAIEVIIRAINAYCLEMGYAGHDEPPIADQVKALKPLIDHSLIYTNSVHTQAVQVTPATIRAVKEGRLKIGAVSVGVAKTEPSIDIHAYLKELNRVANEEAAKRLGGSDKSGTVLATIEDIYNAYKRLQKNEPNRWGKVVLFVKEVERGRGQMGEDHSLLPPALFTQYHPEFETGGNSNARLMRLGIELMKGNETDQALRKLAVWFNYIKSRKLRDPQYQSKQESSMKELWKKLITANKSAHLNEVQMRLLKRIGLELGWKLDEDKRPAIAA